ncbi:pentatricopeptide repeat-containing protein [Quercus suber]|uniref:Pentatricopeptide repeat-containing protein n=1 Tax=Quercus suber TaxID=58331 RepID=A0AAW0KXU7_QUESU
MNRAVMMLDELVSAGIVPNTVTYNTMLNGVCSDILERAMILTAKLLKMAFVPNVVTTNVVLSQFCKQGMPERALMWCQKLSEISFDFDEITYRIMDRAYRDIEEDAELFRRESAKSLFLDFAHLHVEGNMVQARKLFDGIHDMGVYPDVTMFNTLMDGYIKARDTAQANMLYDEMKNKGVSPDGITFNILVAGHYRFGREEDENGFPINKVAYTLLLDGYSKIGDLEGAQNLWNEMALRGYLLMLLPIQPL